MIDRDPPPIAFENEADVSVWVGYNPHAPDAFRVRDSRWRMASPGDRVVLSDGGECLQTGEFVVATTPDESAVIDAIALGNGDNEFCPGDVWTWSGNDRSD